MSAPTHTSTPNSSYLTYADLNLAKLRFLPTTKHEIERRNELNTTTSYNPLNRRNRQDGKIRKQRHVAPIASVICRKHGVDDIVVGDPEIWRAGIEDDDFDIWVFGLGGEVWQLVAVGFRLGAAPELAYNLFYESVKSFEPGIVLDIEWWTCEGGAPV